MTTLNGGALKQASLVFTLWFLLYKMIADVFLRFTLSWNDSEFRIVIMLIKQIFL